MASSNSIKLNYWANNGAFQAPIKLILSSQIVTLDNFFMLFSDIVSLKEPKEGETYESTTTLADGSKVTKSYKFINKEWVCLN